MLFSIAVCTALPCAGENIPGSLCGNQEKVYASCTLKNNKIVSFCGVPASDKNKGMVLVQYRYGLPENIELKYPEEAMSPEGVFFKIDSSCGVIGGVDKTNMMCGDAGVKSLVALTFYSGLFRYSFFYQGDFNDHTLESERMGLKVDKKEFDKYKKNVFFQLCDEKYSETFNVDSGVFEEFNIE